MVSGSRNLGREDALETATHDKRNERTLDEVLKLTDEMHCLQGGFEVIRSVTLHELVQLALVCQHDDLKVRIGVRS